MCRPYIESSVGAGDKVIGVGVHIYICERI